MKKRIGLFTSGWDKVAWKLIDTVYQMATSGIIPDTEIAFIFSSRTEGENPESDRVIRNCRKLGIPLVTFSAAQFKKQLPDNKKGKWRELYDKKIIKILPPTDFDVLLGYMLIAGEDLCGKRTMINLHPALPGGPQGTFRDVVWKLIKIGAKESGVMIHLVVPKLDSGPVISYCRYPINGQRVDCLRKTMQGRLLYLTLDEIKKREGDSNQFFRFIRQCGVRREFPLIIQTLKAIAEERIDITWPSNVNLTKEVEGDIEGDMT
ncbi:MAG: formyltransferase family protein [Parcubacteria group bacterium]|jgi:phosphoribosylglycinamide formyltransferase-1